MVQSELGDRFEKQGRDIGKHSSEVSAAAFWYLGEVVLPAEGTEGGMVA